MATVYLARDIRHQRPVALKVLSPELGAVLGLDRFLAEIRVTATLQHPNLLPLFDSGEFNGQPFYVMPYVDGESLRQRLDRERQLPVDEAIRIAVAVAGALEYAHAHGVIHRDLKPENILLQSGQPMVADFGIALAVSRAGGARVTQTGLSLGTPQYMSPEQAAGDKAVDGRTDIYSLAAVTYEMLTGEPPHSGATIQAVIARILNERPRGVRTVRPSVPEYAAVAIERALEKLPADRWASPREFADALQGRTVALPPPTHLDASARTAPSWRRSARASAHDPIVLGALALAVIGAAFGVWASTRTVVDDSGIAVRFTIAPGAPFATGSQIAISPDGRLITYIVTGELGYSGLVVREVGQLNARVIPGTDAALEPFFSPDGTWIGFVTAGGRALRKVRVGGGPIVTICDASNIQGAWWASPDTIIASVRDSLMIVSAMTGKLQPIAGAMAEGEGARRNPRVLDDGKTILYQSWRGTFATSKIGVTSLSTGKTQILDIAGASPVAVVDGRLIYGSSTRALMAVPFDVSRGRVSGPALPVIDQVEVTFNGLVRAAVSRSGSLIYDSGAGVSQVVLADTLGHVRVLVQEPRNYASPRLSPDGKRLALTIASTIGTRGDIWIYDIASATLTKLTSDGELNNRPEWSPDGKRVIYVSNRGGRAALWQQNADLSGAAELIQAAPELINGGVVSPDGRALVYWQSTPGIRTRTSDIFYRALAGDTTSKPVAATTSAAETSPWFSPDGKWVAYTSNQDGMFQVYVQPFPPSGVRYQVTTAGGMAPIWSRDGSRIFYVWNSRLNAATVRTSPTFAVLTRTAVLEGNYLLNMPPHANYGVSSDGKSFVLLRPVGQSNEIVVVHGWKYELRERTPGRPGR
jgi:serine/threonine-protein kinase